MATIHESAFDAEIMNTMIICSRAACSMSAPSRIARTIMPGTVMIPITLTEEKRWPEDEQKSMSGTRAHVPHLVDSRHQCKAQGFSLERTTCLKAR